MSLLARRRVLMMGGRTSPKVYRDGVWSADSGGAFGIGDIKFPTTPYTVGSSPSVVGVSATDISTAIELNTSISAGNTTMQVIGVRTANKLNLAGYSAVKVVGKSKAMVRPERSSLNIVLLGALPEDVSGNLAHDYHQNAVYWQLSETPVATIYVPGYKASEGLTLPSSADVSFEGVFSLPDMSAYEDKMYLGVIVETQGYNGYITSYDLGIESITLE